MKVKPMVFKAGGEWYAVHDMTTNSHPSWRAAMDDALGVAE